MTCDVFPLNPNELVQRHHHVPGLIVIGEKDRSHQRRFLNFGGIPLEL
jgi:hypothetical protein